MRKFASVGILFAALAAVLILVPQARWSPSVMDIVLGAVVASVEKDYTGGQIESTGKDTDLAIEGEGYFTVMTSAGRLALISAPMEA